MKAVLTAVLLIGEVGFQDRLSGLDQVPVRSGTVTFELSGKLFCRLKECYCP